MSGSPVTVQIAHRGGQTSTPSSVTFAAGASRVSYEITGKALGTDTLLFTAPGYATARLIVDVK